MIPSLSLREIVGPPGAPLLVLGPSLGTSTAVWDGAVAGLSGFRLAAWDLPGHGGSAVAAASFRVGDLADAVIRALDGIGADRVHYAGVSLGGAVGLDMAIRYPERLHAASIVCSGAVIGTPEGWRARAAQVRGQGTASLVAASAARWFAPDTVADPDVVDGLFDDLAAVDDESYARCCEALASYDARARLTGVAVPVQAIWAEHDVVTPEASSREIVDGIPGSVLDAVAAAGHLAVAERPLEVAQLVGAFQARTAVAS